jgi:hypothetical protein
MEITSQPSSSISKNSFKLNYNSNNSSVSNASKNKLFNIKPASLFILPSTSSYQHHLRKSKFSYCRESKNFVSNSASHSDCSSINQILTVHETQRKKANNEISMQIVDSNKILANTPAILSSSSSSNTNDSATTSLSSFTSSSLAFKSFKGLHVPNCSSSPTQERKLNISCSAADAYHESIEDYSNLNADSIIIDDYFVESKNLKKLKQRNHFKQEYTTSASYILGNINKDRESLKKIANIPLNQSIHITNPTTSQNKAYRRAKQLLSPLKNSFKMKSTTTKTSSTDLNDSKNNLTSFLKKKIQLSNSFQLNSSNSNLKQNYHGKEIKNSSSDSCKANSSKIIECDHLKQSKEENSKACHTDKPALTPNLSIKAKLNKPESSNFEKSNPFFNQKNLFLVLFFLFKNLKLLKDDETLPSINSKKNILNTSIDAYSFSKNTKRWRSMYALRDSIRNLTSCVTSRSNLIQK